MTHLEKASALHSEGFNCAQSVFAAFAGEMGLDEAAALKIASTFGGGLGGSGECCGALLGLLMALGLETGFSEFDAQKKAQQAARAKEAVAAFRERFGATACPALKVDFAHCHALVLGAAELAEQLLPQAQND